MNNLSPLAVAVDAWWAAQHGTEAIASRQRARLVALVTYARERSRFYAERYRGLPEPVTGLRELPPASKAELMAQFDAWGRSGPAQIGSGRLRR